MISLSKFFSPNNLFWLLGVMVLSCCEQANFSNTCSLKNNNCFEISGQINEKHLRYLEDVASQVDLIQVNSKGGPVGPAAKIANLVYEHKIELHIIKYCSSSCAEFLLPAAKRVIAHNLPVVGVHGNPLVDAELYKQKSGKTLDSCPWPAKNTLENLYRNKNLNLRFTKSQIERLGVNSFTYKSVPLGQCIRDIELTTVHWQWQPTSAQLEEHLGVSIEGELCADNDNCWMSWADRSNRSSFKSRTCLFGDKVRAC